MSKEFDYSFIEHAYTASKPACKYWSILSIDIRNLVIQVDLLSKQNHVQVFLTLEFLAIELENLRNLGISSAFNNL